MFLFRLEILNLNANRLDKIRLPSENATGKTYLFPALQQLHLSKNCISEVSIVICIMNNYWKY